MQADEWIELHMLLFGMTSEKEGDMVSAWADEFLAAGFTPDELALASRELAFRRGIVNQREHVPTLAAIIRERREQLASAEQLERWRDEQRKAKPAGDLLNRFRRGIGDGGNAK